MKFNFNGLFGNSEMEKAAKIIVAKCLEAKTWKYKFRFSDFLNIEGETEGNEWAMKGFLELLHRGWFQKWVDDFLLNGIVSTGQFVVTTEFVARVNPRIESPMACDVSTPPKKDSAL